MKIQIMRSIAIVGLFFLFTFASVSAQTPGRAEVNIPFDFSAGKAKLKAGNYSIRKLSGNAFAIRSADGKTAAVTNAPLTLGSRDSKAGERLVFNKYGGQYFFFQVWFSLHTAPPLFSTGSGTNVSPRRE